MRQRNVILLSLLVTLAVLLASSACKQLGQPPQQKASSDDSNRSGSQLQIAFITNGPVSDFGYNYTHNEGRLALEQSLGDSVKTIVVESIPETADAERVMERLINTGVNVIVATSFGYQDATLSVASRHPEVRFLQAWGFKYAPNVGSYSAKMYEVWYLMGIVAGHMTKTNKLGIVAAHPVPPMKWQINAYVLGARSVNPNITATVTFINDWYDPVLSSQAAEALINQGHDVVCGVLDNSVGVARAAEKRGTWFIGHNADLSKFAPTRQLVGTRWVWGNLYEDEVRMMLENKWKGEMDMAGGLRSGYVGITDFSPSVPEEVRQEVLVAQRRIINGEINVYAGPIRDNTGHETVPAGKTLTHEETMAMDWLVEGVR
ncbi:MAG: basic rane protein [Acidobacteriota bacterium]|nr:basic rane protein [Acidobacteriota bacterium]